MTNNTEQFIEELNQLHRRFSVHRFLKLITPEPEREQLDYEKSYFFVTEGSETNNKELSAICAEECFRLDGENKINPFKGCKKYRLCEVTTGSFKDTEKRNRFHCWDAYEPNERCNNENWHKIKISKDRDRWLDRTSENENQNPYGIFPEGGCNDCFKGRMLCRDALPCPFFGCVTKKMVENFSNSINTSNGEKLAIITEKAGLCPFKYYFPKDEKNKKNNPFRYLQCYVSSKDHIRFLENKLSFLGAGFTFYDWTKEGKHVHYQKSSEDVIDIPWRYYDDIEGWKEAELDYFIPSVFQGLRDKELKPTEFPEFQKEFREPLDEQMGSECVTDGEISFFIFSSRFLDTCNEIFYKKDIQDMQCIINDAKTTTGKSLSLTFRTINQKEIGPFNFYKSLLFSKKENLNKIFKYESDKFGLILQIDFWEEMQIEGLAEKLDRKCNVKIRFLNLIEYIFSFYKQKKSIEFNNRFCNKLNNNSPIKTRFEKYIIFLDNLRKEKKWASYSIDCNEFIEDIIFLLKLVYDIFRNNSFQLEKDCRFPILPYLVWRTQSDIPFCHLWFPVSNQSICNENGHFRTRYTVEGSECVSVFAQISFKEDGNIYPTESPWEFENESELVSIIKRHKIYMQLISLPMIDSVMYGHKIIPYFKQHEEKIENLNRILADFQHILLKTAIESANEALESLKSSKYIIEYNIVRDIIFYIKKRGDYIKNLSDYLIESKKSSINEWGLSDMLPPECMFIKKLFENTSMNWEDKKDKLLGIFKLLFTSNGQTKEYKISNAKDINIKFSLPDGQAIATILEGLIHNSLIKHRAQQLFNDDKLYVYIHIIKSDSALFLCYWDTGEGFEKGASEKIPLWMEGKIGPSSSTSSGFSVKGFTYWLINTIKNHIKECGGNCMFDFFSINKQNIIVQKCNLLNDNYPTSKKNELALNNLSNDRERIIHVFKFTQENIGRVLK